MNNNLVKIECNEFSYIIFKKSLEQSNKQLTTQQAIIYHKKINKFKNIPNTLVHDFNNLIYKYTNKSQLYLKYLFSYHYNIIKPSTVFRANFNNLNNSNNNLDLIIHLYFLIEISNECNIPLYSSIYRYIPSEIPFIHSDSKFNTKKMSRIYYIYLISTLIILKYLNEITKLNQSLKNIIINLEKTLSKVTETEIIKQTKKDIQQFYNNSIICLRLYNDTKTSTM